MKRLFYQNYRQLNGSVDPTESKYDINEAITLHPFKNHTYLYMMQQYVYKQNMINLQKRKDIIEKDILIFEQISKGTSKGIETGNLVKHNAYRKVERHLINEWTAYKGKNYFSHFELNPKHAIEEPDLKFLIDTIYENEKQYSEKNKKDGQYFFVKSFEHGYKHVSPLGIQFLLNLKVCCMKGKQGLFAQNLMYQATRDLSALHISEEKVILEQHHPKYNELIHLTKQNLHSVINFIIPLSGKLFPFLKFINNFEKSFLQQAKKVSLVIVLFWNHNNQKESWEIVSSVKLLKKEFPHLQIDLIQRRGEFNRGVALNIGASIFEEDDLLFFVDVDCLIFPDILERIILNTIQHEQAYFPIMFSLYNPQFVWKKIVNFKNISFAEEIGYWRFHSFGQLSVYKSDFTNIGGYDSNIRGWGKEDIDLFQKVLDKGIRPFRAPDPGLIHIFHDVHCGLELSHEQYRMCLGTKWSTFGCQNILSDIVYSRKEIFNRNKDSN